MRTSLIITTYNRYDYLYKCLDSVSSTYIEPGSLIYIIDDGSTDPRVIKLISEFKKEGCEIITVFKPKNKGLYDSFLTAYDYCFNNSDYVINIGSDIIVNNYFYDMMTYYNRLFPNNIISGFNTLTISELGTSRHPIIKDGGFYAIKDTSGSACFGITEGTYNLFFKSTLIDLQRRNLKCYDTISSKKASVANRNVICTVPSVVEHIGFESTMNHSNNPDVSIDFRDEIKLLDEDKKLITFNFATYPKREKELGIIINSLLKIDVIDKIRVYLNEYTYVPSYLQHDKIEYVIGLKNIKDSGKFYWATSYSNEYYFSMDDDLLVDENYINSHIKILNEYDNEVFVSLHGKILKAKPENFRDFTKSFHCLEDSINDEFINFPGTGVMVFDNMKYKFPEKMFKFDGMTDLWVAQFCQLHRIPCIARGHKKGDISLIYDGPDTLWNNQGDLIKHHKLILNSIPKWNLYKKNKSK